MSSTDWRPSISSYTMALPMNDIQIPTEVTSRDERKAQQAAADRSRARKASIKKALKYLFVAAIPVAVVALIIVAAQGSSTNAPIPLPSAITTDDWTKGNPNANVTIVEYSDAQCPTCAYFNPLITRMLEDYGDEVYFAYRHFPLSIHSNSQTSARAAEAAGKQGQFFEMLNVLFAKQNEWGILPNPQSAFVSYATSLGLNVDQFTTDYNSAEVKDLVKADLISAERAGLQGTPTFFVNGQQIDLPKGGYDGLVAVIEAALAQTAQAPVTE